ncbi:EthD domain-containing protein [Natrarchaeobius chitinivorans]|uniref:EthD family reductase n=1 Tax=Natrarchaeobius chitinivorans TaxID=1679083 RepID=A0A3N6M3P1_NATCH|nr:EthD family reductase [Natrarchaeobius chitinivorans]RQG98093.1 EthD family reductase [Natrarchaeobius chitinivorans]
MYKHVAPLVRREGMSHEEFLEHWQTQHAPIAREIEGVVRYEQVVPTDPGNAEFDGVAELSFEDLESLHDALGSPGSRDYDPERGKAREARRDVDDFLAVDERPRFIGEEVVQRDDVDGETDGLYKHSAFLVRQDGMSHEEFLDYWQNHHTPIAREIEGVVRYTTVLPTDPDAAEFDGVAELYFEDLEKLYDALGSEGSRDYDPEKGKAREARRDVDNFLAVDDRPRFIGRTHLIEGG